MPTMENKGIFVFFMVVFCLSVIAIGVYEGINPDVAQAQPEPGETVLLATATLYAGDPSATPSPTITQRPTDNTAATVAVLNVTAAADNARAASVQATALIDAANISAAAVVRQAESNERVAQAAIVLQETINKGKEIERGFQAIAAERDRLHNETLSLEIRGKGVWADYILAIGLCLLAVGILALAFRPVRQSFQSSVSAKPNIQQYQPRPVVQVNDADGLGAFQLDDDDAAFLGPFAARLALVMDEPMSFRGVQAVIKRADWERIRWTLLDLGLADKNADQSISMNKTGIDTINKLLPHYASLSPKPVQSAGTTQHGTAQHRGYIAEGEVAGV